MAIQRSYIRSPDVRAPDGKKHSRVERLQHVPESVVEEVKQRFLHEGAEVKPIKEDDGNYTIEAYF